MYSLLNLMNTTSPDDTSNRKRLVRDTLLEFMATTLFVFAGTLGAASTGRQLVGEGLDEDVARVLPIAICFGVSILYLAYSIGHMTGGHMNPAVSLTMALKRQMSFTKMACYWFAQFLGAMLGSAILWGCISGSQGKAGVREDEVIGRPPLLLGATVLDPIINVGNGFLLELMGSFIFYFVICQTALDKRGIAQSMFPAIPIGLSLVVVHIGLIPFTGCGVNPGTRAPALLGRIPFLLITRP